MANFLKDYLVKTEFTDYEDFARNYILKVPERFNFAYDIVDRYGKEYPDKRAIVWCDVQGNEAEFTFKDIMEKSNQAANLLRRLGVKKGDAVMLVLKRRYEFWFYIYALHKLGAIAIPATHLLTAKDIVYRCDAADITTIIAWDEEPLVSAVDAAGAICPSLENKLLVGGQREGWVDADAALAEESVIFQKPADEDLPHNNDTMLMYFTSGTTGMPKMVAHDYTYPLGHIITAKYWHNVVDDGLHISVADTGWAKAGWGKIYGQWIAGTAQFIYDFDKFVPKDLLEVITKYKVTTFCAPPTIYRFIIKEDLSKYDFSALKYASTAGEALNPEVFNQFREATGITIKEAFGQSESTPILGTFTMLEAKPGSGGKPSPAFHVDLIDEQGRPCDVGEEGELVIYTGDGKPVGLFQGYYRAEELTQSCWSGGVYHTGDLAWRDEDGYFWFVGRADDIIKSSGYRIGPFEVESVLMQHPAVLECAITGVPDPVRGQLVKATIVLAAGYEASDDLAKELQTHVKKNTAPYKYPRVVEFVEELPKTISGKIRRNHLRDKDKKKK